MVLDADLAHVVQERALDQRPDGAVIEPDHHDRILRNIHTNIEQFLHGITPESQHAGVGTRWRKLAIKSAVIICR